MRALVSGGGTAGHTHPALSVAAELASGEHDSVGFVGTPDGPEVYYAREAGFEYYELRARGFDRAAPLSLISAAFTTLVSAVSARGLLKRERPDVVVGFGGYVTLPLGLACASAGVPLVLHEQNSVPGLANRLLSRWAVAVAATYEESAEHFHHPERVVVTGNPVRSGLAEVGRFEGREALGVPQGAVLLLVFGGSRGARHLNQAVVEAASSWLKTPGCIIVHVSGRLEYADVLARVSEAGLDTGRYRVLEWMDDMGSALGAADLVVARAGASSIAEITAVGRAAVLVPYPYATDDHQTKNAAAVVEAGGAVLVADEDLDGASFVAQVSTLLDNDATREKMATASAALGVLDAAEQVADLARQHASA